MKKRVAAGKRLPAKDVQARSGDSSLVQGPGQCLLVEDGPLGHVHENAGGLHERKLRRSDHPFGLGGLGHADHEEIGPPEQLLKAGVGGAKLLLRSGIDPAPLVIDDLHAERLPMQRDFGPDLAHSQDGQRLTKESRHAAIIEPVRKKAGLVGYDGLNPLFFIIALDHRFVGRKDSSIEGQDQGKGVLGDLNPA